MKTWEQLSPVVVCPFTHEPLRPAGDALVAASGRSYPMTGGVPVLRPGPPPVVKDPNHVSNGLAPEFRRAMADCPGDVLFLGAGASDYRADHVFEVEYDRFRDTDVVGDAHCLPFRDGAFELAVAQNVFEHLREPHLAAAELRRVLAPGGRLMIHTAFLQPLHEAPHHYYGATEFGVRQWFHAFAAVDVRVSWNFSPFHALSWTVHDLLAAVGQTLGSADQKTLADLTLGELAVAWRDQHAVESPALRVLSRLPPAVQARFAAGFELSATR